MNQRTLGRTGLRVSEVGFGAWQLGNTEDWGPMSDREAVALVHEAVAHGCTFFDTAPNYARGRSEALLGQALADRRSRVTLCTKFGTHPNGERNFDPARLRPSIERSLATLRTDVLDVVVLHNPPRAAYAPDHPLQEGLRSLREEGLIRAWGLSVDTGAEMVPILAHSDAQVIEINFNLLHQEPRAAFAQARAQGVGLVVKGPLDSGWLSGKYDERTRFTDVRSRWSEATIARRAELVDALRPLLPTEELAPLALSWVLTHDAVSTVIPGTRTSEQLHSNLSAAASRIPEAARDAIRAFWEERFSGHDLLPW